MAADSTTSPVSLAKITKESFSFNKKLYGVEVDLSPTSSWIPIKPNAVHWCVLHGCTLYHLTLVIVGNLRSSLIMQRKSFVSWISDSIDISYFIQCRTVLEGNH